MDTQHTYIIESGQPTQRRRKARFACNPCRARKTGCDGRKPVCTGCSLRGWEDKCGYPSTVMQPSAALTLVELDRRLQKLENEVRTEPEAFRSARAEAGPSAVSTFVAATGFHRDGDGSTHCQVDSPARMRATNVTFMHQGLEAAGSHLFHDADTSSESPKTDIEPPNFPDLVGLPMQPLAQPLEEIDPRAMALPPRQFADDLLRWYWRNVHSIFPFLHWPMFENRYRTLWKQEKRPSHEQTPFEELLFYATVNMVLALACYRNETIPLDQRQVHAEEFYKRSLRLISAETLDSASIPIVQLLLLRAMYLYYAGRADRCWLMSGAAVRVAIGLGLHVPPKRSLSQLEREMRRRVWYAGCVSLEQIIASTFGRPTMTLLTQSQVPLPLAIDEEYLSTTEEGRQPDGIPSRIEMINYIISTMDVLEEMRAVLRAPRLKVGRADDEFSVPDPTALLRINSKLDYLLEGMPPHLRVNADLSALQLTDDAVQCFRIQAHAIRFRLLILRVFLLRPSLLAEAQRWTRPNNGSAQTASLMMQERFHLELCSLCLATVHTILEEIHKSISRNGGISAWYALQLTFASAAVLLVAVLSPNLGVRLDVEPAKTSWDRAMAILDLRKANVASAARGIEVLQRYRESIVARVGARLGNVAGSTHGIPDITFLAPSSSSYEPGDHLNYQQQAQHAQQVQHNSHHQPQQTQQDHQQLQYSQPQQPPTQLPWQPSHTVPTTPPTASDPLTSLMESLDEFLTSDGLDEAWLSTQDWGQGDWMLHY
ncbi:hypothetical protein VTI74DRAFT_6891 [Chaetomium olivicolor]